MDASNRTSDETPGIPVASTKKSPRRRRSKSKRSAPKRARRRRRAAREKRDDVFAPLLTELGAIDFENALARDAAISAAIAKTIVLVASTPDLKPAERLRVQLILNLAAQLKSFRDVDKMRDEVEKLRVQNRKETGAPPTGPQLVPVGELQGRGIRSGGAGIPSLRGRPRKSAFA